MGVSQLSESDAVNALRLPFSRNRHLNQSQGEMYISLDRTIGAHPVGA